MTKTKRMRKVWTRRTIEAPVPEVWHLLTDTSTWPVWGPSVRGATVNQPELALGATGTVDTIAGVRLPFEITAFDADSLIDSTLDEAEYLQALTTLKAGMFGDDHEDALPYSSYG